MPRPTSPPRGHLEQLADLRANEEVAWVCYSQENDAPFIVVRGWTELVRRLAMECIDVAAAPAALSQAEAWLLNDGTWQFGTGGLASWRIMLPDGAWIAILMPKGCSLDQVKQRLIG